MRPFVSGSNGRPEGRFLVQAVRRCRPQAGEGWSRRRIDIRRGGNRRGCGRRMSTYASLALVVIDEEQRFGAADKATLRNLAVRRPPPQPYGHANSAHAPECVAGPEADVCHRNAPCTPPADPHVSGVFDERQVRAALLREKDRGGQSFVVVPRIQDLTNLDHTSRTVGARAVIPAGARRDAGGRYR